MQSSIWKNQTLIFEFRQVLYSIVLFCVFLIGMEAELLPSACFSYVSFKYYCWLVVLPASVFRVVSSILNEIEESMERSSLLEDFKMSELPALKAKCIQLVELLVTITIENESVKIDYAVISHCWLLKDNILQFLKLEGNENQSGNVVKVLQDMFELVTYDMMTDGSRLGFLRGSCFRD